MRRRTALESSARSSVVDLPTHRVREVVAGAGPGRHWYCDALPLRVRRLVDLAVGGPGHDHPPPGRPLLRPGDRVGFWVVEESPDDTLALRAEVRAPGVVRLLTTWAPGSPGGRTRVDQVVAFEPRGVLGRAYLLADLGAREAVVELVHRRLLAELGEPEAARS